MVIVAKLSWRQVMNASNHQKPVDDRRSIEQVDHPASRSEPAVPRPGTATELRFVFQPQADPPVLGFSPTGCEPTTKYRIALDLERAARAHYANPDEFPAIIIGVEVVVRRETDLSASQLKELFGKGFEALDESGWTGSQISDGRAVPCQVTMRGLTSDSESLIDEIGYLSDVESSESEVLSEAWLNELSLLTSEDWWWFQKIREIANSSASPGELKRIAGNNPHFSKLLQDGVVFAAASQSASRIESSDVDEPGPSTSDEEVCE